MTQLTRREFNGSLAAAAAAPKGRPQQGWTKEWDQAVIGAALAAMDLNYDSGEAMLARRVGSDYNYHSAMRNAVVHPTRESLEYALLLLEAGGEERDARARQVIDRVISIQETDPKSRFYGIWGYYLEEPAPRMAPADFNWADFNGATLLLIEYRHGARLGESLRQRVRESIRHAMISIRRRNVSMSYTNIAVQGTFVTLAGAQLLGDKDMWDYATDRQRRFAKTVDETGSFAEYNSPTYANVSIVNLTRIRMLVEDPDVLKLNDRLHERVWLHLGKHWHVPTRQLAGPMSRCYSTDIGKPLWLQKALGGRLEFASLEEVESGSARGSGEIGILDYRCPETVAHYFLKDQPPRQHRELFTPNVQGTTWLDRSFCLGSANRSDFWIQRRPVLAYWGGPQRPARYAQLRFFKDDYDFASALSYATQEQNRVLGLVCFRSPGGDKHVSIDVIKSGEFKASSLRLSLVIADPEAKISLEKRKALVSSGSVALSFELRAGRFGAQEPAMRLGREGPHAAIIVDLFRSPEPQLIRWSELAEAYAVYTLAVNAAKEEPFECKVESGAARLRWGALEMTGAARVAAVKEQDAAFTESRNGKPVEVVRLDARRLL